MKLLIKKLRALIPIRFALAAGESKPLGDKLDQLG